MVILFSAERRDVQNRVSPITRQNFFSNEKAHHLKALVQQGRSGFHSS